MYIVGTDYDGTLNRGGISPYDREMIHRFRAAGHQFGLVTGRDYYMYETLRHENLEFDFIIALNGAMTVNCDGSIGMCKESDMPDHVFREVVEFVGKFRRDVSWLLVKDRRNYCSDPSFVNYPVGTPEEAEAVHKFTHLNTWFYSYRDAKEVATEGKRRWSDTFNVLQNGNCVDFPPIATSKGDGIAKYAESLGVPAENVFCVGDNLNDLDMIGRFNGCAVCNACGEAMTSARYIVDSVGKVLEMLLMRKDG